MSEQPADLVTHKLTGQSPRRSCTCGSSVASGIEVGSGDRVTWCSQSAVELERIEQSGCETCGAPDHARCWPSLTAMVRQS